MRIVYWLLFLLTGCASHAVRCDSHLQAINPTVLATAPAVSAPRSTP
jgi:hypothetical protein